MQKNSFGVKGQAGIYVIIAVVILLAIVGYFLFTKVFAPSAGNGEFNEVYQYYDSCISNQVKDAINLAGTQGGRLYLPSFLAGSEYAPFSSQYNFLGFAVPYWMYMTGNGLVREQVPSKNSLEKEMERYLNENVKDCNFDDFYKQGYDISLGNVSSKVSISDGSVDVTVNSPLSVKKDNSSAVVSSRSLSVQSNLGLLLGEALNIYSKEKSEAFLENYTVDVLRLNAPVDGTLIQCNPQTWSTSEIKNKLDSATEANLGALKFKPKDGNYFSVGYGSKVNARVLYNSKDPQVFEINGEGAGKGALIAQAVGNQAGMGILGFCYVPYHFVYDWRFPALIQLMAGDEVFQFPLVVVVDKNLPRNGVYTNSIDLSGGDFDLCSVKNEDVSIKSYDIALNPIDTNVFYQCFDQECALGNTINGTLETKAPACVNGFLVARADGFDDSAVKFSSNEENHAEIILDRSYNVSLKILVDGKAPSGSVLVSFEGRKTASAILPQSPNVQLSEGDYNISVMVYDNSSIIIPASSSKQCFDVSDSGVLGFFGSTSQKCVDVNIPETKVEYALEGGGKSETYLLPSDLSNGTIVLAVKGLNKPQSLDDLQNNYATFEAMGVEVNP